jgi:putative heme iron utilization protein
MSKTQHAAKQARALFQSQSNGVLSTHSNDLPGYPFGSITPYCLNGHGEPVILISTIAQHTRNIATNNKVSLICYDKQADDQQAAGRITYIADAIPFDDKEMAERYYHFFPSSRDFHKTHDFNFYRLDLVRARYIGGFGQIYWLEKADFLKESPFSFQEESGMIEHMNSDHTDAIQHYCDLFEITTQSDNPAVLVGIDSEGFHLRTGSRIHRIAFEQEASNAIDVRKALVNLAQRPK